MSRGPVILALCVAATLSGPADAHGQAITVEPCVISTDAGAARGLVATIRLDDPRLDVVVTGPLDSAGRAAGAEAVGIPVDEWASAVGAALAVNANFFGGAGDGAGLDIIGLSVSDRRLVSPARAFAGRWDPSVVFLEDGMARAGQFPPDAIAAITEAVAGVGGSDRASEEGTALVTAGVGTAEGARVEPFARHPRTVVGVDASGTVLTVAVLDGRQPGWSVGVTLPEAAEFLIARGVHDAVNLDGGGSSSFVCVPSPGAEPITNRPSDGRFRPVANHLGFVEKRAGSRSVADPDDASGPFLMCVGGAEALREFVAKEIER